MNIKQISIYFLLIFLAGCTVLETYQDGETTTSATPFKNSGIRYYRGDNMNTATGVDTTYGSEVAMFVDSSTLGIWDRENEVFIPPGGITKSNFPPSTAPSTGQPKAYINAATGIIYRWTGSAWSAYGSGGDVTTAQLADSTAAIRADLSPVPADTVRSIVYAPAHGYTLGSFPASVIAVKNNYETANATHLDSIQYLYVVGVPDVDSLEVKGTGEVYRPSHGLTVGSTYYLQNTPNSSFGLSPGTVSSPVFFVLDADNILLLGQGATAKEAIPRKLIPASIITSFGGEPFAPHDTVIQNIAEVFAANGTITPPTILITQSSGSTRNAVHQGATGDPSTPANSWLWDGALVTRIAYATVSISMQDTVWGTLFNLPLDTVELIAGVPTDSTVADWLETNYTDNGLRLKNGDMMYWGGTKTSPDYIWIVADDLNSIGIGGNNYDKIIKRIKEPGVTENIPTLERVGADSLGLVGGNRVLDKDANFINYGSAELLQNGGFNSSLEDDDGPFWTLVDGAEIINNTLKIFDGYGLISQSLDSLSQWDIIAVEIWIKGEGEANVSADLADDGNYLIDDLVYDSTENYIHQLWTIVLTQPSSDYGLLMEFGPADTMYIDSISVRKVEGLFQTGKDTDIFTRVFKNNTYITNAYKTNSYETNFYRDFNEDSESTNSFRANGFTLDVSNFDENKTGGYGFYAGSGFLSGKNRDSLDYDIFNFRVDDYTVIRHSLSDNSAIELSVNEQIGGGTFGTLNNSVQIIYSQFSPPVEHLLFSAHLDEETPVNILGGEIVNFSNFGAGEITGTATYLAAFDADGNLIEEPLSGGNASASDTTDGSGDLTITHGLGSADIAVSITPTGTTPYHTTVHTKTSTTFKIRFFDSSGAAVTSTAVEADWAARKN